MIRIEFSCDDCGKTIVESRQRLSGCLPPMGWWETADHGLLCPECVLAKPELPRLAAFSALPPESA